MLNKIIIVYLNFLLLVAGISVIFLAVESGDHQIIYAQVSISPEGYPEGHPLAPPQDLLKKHHQEYLLIRKYHSMVRLMEYEEYLLIRKYHPHPKGHPHLQLIPKYHLHHLNPQLIPKYHLHHLNPQLIPKYHLHHLNPQLIPKYHLHHLNPN